jgi:hypothetical protein
MLIHFHYCDGGGRVSVHLPPYIGKSFLRSLFVDYIFKQQRLSANSPWLSHVHSQKSGNRLASYGHTCGFSTHDHAQKHPTTQVPEITPHAEKYTKKNHQAYSTQAWHMSMQRTHRLSHAPILVRVQLDVRKHLHVMRT